MAADGDDQQTRGAGLPLRKPGRRDGDGLIEEHHIGAKPTSPVATLGVNVMR